MCIASVCQSYTNCSFTAAIIRYYYLHLISEIFRFESLFFFFLRPLDALTPFDTRLVHLRKFFHLSPRHHKGIMQHLVTLLVAAATSSLAAQAADVTLDWNVGYVQNVNPDGKFERRAISVNGQFPTPIIVSDNAQAVLWNRFLTERSCCLRT